MIKKKKIFPKFKKKLNWFLSDESAKMSMKDILWISLWASLLSVNESSAYTFVLDGVWTWTNNLSHSQSASYLSPDTSPSCTAVSHASGTVNGHYSSVPSTPTFTAHNSTAVSWSSTIAWHASHGSHGSHGSSWWDDDA